MYKIPQLNFGIFINKSICRYDQFTSLNLFRTLNNIFLKGHAPMTSMHSVHCTYAPIQALAHPYL